MNYKFFVCNNICVCSITVGGLRMTKKSKSKRFTAQGADSVRKHDERFPYKERLADLDQNKTNV